LWPRSNSCDREVNLIEAANSRTLTKSVFHGTTSH
jgi:hypothetical protein